MKYIGTPSTNCESFLWIGIVAFQFFLAAFLIREVTQSWAESPIVTVSDLVSAENVDFPSITICPPGNDKYFKEVLYKNRI